MKITFVKSPTGVHKLAYSAGESADIESKLAKNLIKDGFAIEVELSEEEIAEAAKAVEAKKKKAAAAKLKKEAKAAEDAKAAEEAAKAGDNPPPAN